MKKFLSVLLAVMMVLSTVSFAAPTAVTVSDSAEDIYVPVDEEEIVPVETADLAAEDTWYDTTKGTLLFNMDFETDNSGNAVTTDAASAMANASNSFSASTAPAVSTLGRINPDVEGSYTAGFRYVTDGSEAIVSDNGNQYLSVTSSGSNQISLYIGNNLFTKTGTYTYEVSYKFVASSTTTLASIRLNEPTVTSNDSNVTNGDWATWTNTFEYSSGSQIRNMFNGSANFSTSDVLYLDDIKVWYYDTSVDYNEKVNGSTGGDSEETVDEWANTAKGYKLFVVDFETKNDGTALVADDYSAITTGRADGSPATAGVAASAIGRTNPNYTVNARVNIKGGSGAALAGTDDKYLTLTSSGDSLILSQIYVGDGTYVFEFETNTVAFNAVRGSYNAGVTPTAAAIDDTWYSTTHTASDMTEALSKSCSSYGTDNIRFHCSTAPTMYDNIVVYYQPTGWTAPSEGGETEEPDTPVVEDVWEDETKGTKLFTIDFETKNDGTALDSTSWDSILNRLDNNPTTGELVSDIGRINPNVTGDDYRISINYIDNSLTALVKDGDNTTLELAPQSGKGDLSLYLGGFYEGEGTYIFETSYKFVQTGTNAVGQIRYETIGAVYTDSSYFSTGDWVDLSEVHEHASSDTHADVNRLRITTPDFSNTPYATTDRIYLDNITVYYQSPDFEAPADPEWTDETYGDKLFVIDLDGDTNYLTADLSKLNKRIDGTSDNSDANGLYAEAIGRVNPDYATSYANTFKYSFKDGGTPTVTGDTDKYFTHTATTNPSVMVANPFVGAGTYTLVFNHETAKTFNVHSGYTGSSLITTAVDDTWSQSVYTIDLASQGADDYFRIIATNGAGTYLIDDVALYYKNTAKDVTVYSNGNANVSDTVVTVNSDTGMTAAELVAKVDTSASTKELLGASLTADGELLAADYVVMPGAVSGIYLIWGDDIVVDDTPWYDEGYGTLLFNINWDGDLATTQQTRWADVRAAGASTNPDWKCFEKCYFMWGTEDIGGGSTWVPATSPLIVAEANGNRYYTEPHNSTYNHWSVYSTFDGDWANWAETAGVFTVTYRIKTIGNITVNNLFIDPQTVKDHATVKQNIRLFATEIPDSSGWTTVTYQFDLSDYDVAEGESLGHVLLYAQTNEASAVSGAYICYDDVKVYYKPSTVNVTMKPGTNLEVNETVVEASTNGVLVSDLIALVNTEDTTMLATGITTEDGSKKYALTDTVVLDADTTFYITWENNEWMDNELGMLIQKADFEGTMQTTTINKWPAATALGATINPDYDFEGVTGLQFTVADTGIAFDESGKWIPADYDVIENGNTYFEIPTANKKYSSTQQLTCVSMYAMGSGATQYAYEGAGTYTITGKVKYGTDIQNATLEIRPNLYDGAGGVSGGYNYKFEDTVAGEWNDFSVTWSTAEDAEYGLGSVQFYLFYDNLTSASTIAYDDIMLYYKPFTAEVTLRANNNPVAKDIVLSDVSTSGITVEELLSNIRTPLGGMDLVGLAYDKAGTNMLEGTIVVGGDSRFFMIWTESELDPNAPVSENVNAIRTDDPIGMRFRAYMTTTVAGSATQIGWVVTRYDLLESAAINPYDFYLDTEVAKVTAYNKDTDVEKFFATDDVNTYITAVLYNIPTSHYETTLVARPFTVVDGVTYYGYPVERSICEVAEAIRDGGYAGCSNDQMTYIKSILEVCGKSTEVAE